MNLIVGVQVYQQATEDGNSPLIITSSSICTVNPDPEEGEELSLHDLAECAIQIHAATHREHKGYTVTKKETEKGTVYSVKPKGITFGGITITPIEKEETE